jgi:hypothetical protein
MINSMLGFPMLSPFALLPALSLALALLVTGNSVVKAEPRSLSTLQQLAQATQGKSIKFQKAEAPVSGSFTINKMDGKTFLVLSDDFSTNDKAPDLHLVVSPSADPIKGSKAPFALKANSYTMIAPLKAFKGGQKYEVPPSVDLKSTGSVLIWCRKFNATMAWAPLK